ncbi:hypothetical protein C8E84_2473 [Ornithinibacter aureus]|nr:hypothetical protein C8E84_2473 [Ornithinibacter aureus]
MVFVTNGSDAVGPVSRAAHPGAWCGQCGEPTADGIHERCDRRAELEPPRFCAHCRRRMKVQVTPGAWTATCVQHGTVEQPTWSA